MITSDEACGSFSSSSASDTLPGNSKETVATLFSQLYKNAEISSSKTTSNLLTIRGTAATETLGTPKKNAVRRETRNEEKPKNELFDVHEKNTFHENDTSLPLSTDTVILDRNKSPSSDSKAPVLLSLLYNDDPSSAYEAEKRNSSSLKLVNAGILRRVCSHSKIPISIRRLNMDSGQTREPLFPSTEMNFRRQPTSSRELSQKRSEKIGSKKYDHIKSKVAAYIHRPTKTECVVRGSARSMSPIDCRTRSDNLYAAGEGIKRMNSRTSLETYTCECKMPSADASFNLDKSENSGESNQKIRRHIELALEHNRQKLEKERIIAEHHRVIAKQHQQVLEHSEKANDSLQKAITLLLTKVTEKS